MSKINDVIKSYLTKQGYKMIDTDMYNKIEIWRQYWNNSQEWHKYIDQSKKEREMYTLGMAKRIAEDWASIIFSERDSIIAGKENNQKYLDKKLEELQFFDDLPEIIEKSSALGTSAVALRVMNAKVKNNIVTADERTKIDLIQLTADQLIPLKVEHSKIIDLAIASTIKKEDRELYYIEIHEKKYDENQKKEIYWISNKYIDSKTGQEVKNDEVAERFTLNSEIPMFSILKTPIVNTSQKGNGLGISMYANALNQIDSCDIAFNNFVMDFYLGGKKVFYNKKIVKTEKVKVKQEDGTYKQEEYEIYPDDITRQQWATYGDEMENINDEPAVKEYNPDLRIEDNKNGVQFSLDLTSFKSSLGTKRYQFNGTTVVTATQYNGDNQDLVRNANKYRKKADGFIKNVCRGLLLLGRILLKEDVTEDDEIKLEDVDGFLVDTEAKYKEMKEEVTLGYRSKLSYLQSRYKLEEEEARKMLKEVEEEDKTKVPEL